MSTRYIWYKYPASYTWGDASTVLSYPWSSIGTEAGTVNKGNTVNIVVNNGNAVYEVPSDGLAPLVAPGRFEGVYNSSGYWTATYIEGGYGNKLLLQKLHPNFVWGLAGYPYTALGASSSDLICVNLSQTDTYGSTSYYAMQEFKVYGAPKGSSTPSGSKVGEVSSNNSGAYPDKDNSTDGYWYGYWASDQPDPTKFIVNGTVGIGKVVTLSATVNPNMKNTTDSKLKVLFIFQVSLNGGNWTDIAAVEAPYSKGGEDVSTTYTIPSGIGSVRFRVYAKDSSGFTSTTYLYSDITNFSKYVVSVAVSPAGGGTVTGGGAYDEGSTATLTATPANGYKFLKWEVKYADGALQEEYRTSITVTVDSNVSATAYFESELTAYWGVSGLSRRVTKMYIGVGGVSRKVVKGYVGVDGKARRFM